MASSHETRFFTNPYPDYNTRAPMSMEQLLKADYWRQFVKEQGFLCISKSKPKSNHSDGTLYTGNLGVIFMAYRMLKSNRFTNYEQDLKNYMIEFLRSNEEYFRSSGISESRDVGFFLGKGGLCVMGCLVARAIGSESQLGKYSQDYANLAPMCEPINFLRNGSDEMFVGRAGYLWYLRLSIEILTYIFRRHNQFYIYILSGLLVLKKYLNIQVK
jgi:hypothetical protein